MTSVFPSDEPNFELNTADVCACCGRIAPAPLRIKMEPGQTTEEAIREADEPPEDERWVTFEAPRLTVYVPYLESMLSLEDREALRAWLQFDGTQSHAQLIICPAAAAEEGAGIAADSELLGLVCPDCYAERDWSMDEWLAWFALRSPSSEESER